MYATRGTASCEASCQARSRAHGAAHEVLRSAAQVGHSCQPSLRSQCLYTCRRHAWLPYVPISQRVRPGPTVSSRRSAQGIGRPSPPCVAGVAATAQAVDARGLLSKARMQHRAHGSVASLGAWPHIFGWEWDVAQGVVCPSAHAHEQDLCVLLVRCHALPRWLPPSPERAPLTHERTILPASPCDAWPRAASAQRIRNCSAAPTPLRPCCGSRRALER